MLWTKGSVHGIKRQLCFTRPPRKLSKNEQMLLRSHQLPLTSDLLHHRLAQGSFSLSLSLSLSISLSLSLSCVFDQINLEAVNNTLGHSELN